jgi:hypothetical protein
MALRYWRSEHVSPLFQSQLWGLLNAGRVLNELLVLGAFGLNLVKLLQPMK